MAGKKSELGPTGTDLANNVTRLRGNMSYNELSRRLALVKRDIPPLGLRRIEAGTRRVDVDDLMALAVVLGVSPITLLAPPGTSAKAAVTATATGKHPAELIWGWLRATDPLHGSGQNFVEFAVRARPEWALDTLGEELQNRKQAHRSELERRRAAKEKGHAAHGND